MPRPQDERPLSPHVGIYRWQLSNGLSILHRITGFGLTFGLILLVLWLWGIAYNEALFALIQGFFSSLVGKLFLLGWTAAFFYHLANGIRHLNWDMGNGFKLDEMVATGYLVVLFTVTMTIFTWMFAHTHGAW